MAGVGEASAIVGIVGLGFSIAAALNTYVSGVSAARDDVTSLSSEIEATLAHLRGLESLIRKNEDTKAWDRDGLELANRAIEDCEKIIKKLRRLVQKASWKDKDDEDLEGFVKSEIDLSKFQRVLWPRLKPDLDLCKGELQRIKLNILLATSAYTLGTVTTDAEKIKHREMMRSVYEAKKRNARKMKRVHERVKIPVPGSGLGRQSRYTPAIASNYDYPYVDDEMDMEIDEDFERFLTQEQEKKEEENLKLLIAAKAQERALEEEKRKKIEEKAIKAHVAKARRIEEETRKKRDGLREKLEQKGGLTPQQIDMVVDEALPLETGNLALLLRHSNIALEPNKESITLKKGDSSSVIVPGKVKKMSRLRNFLQPKKSKLLDKTTSMPSAWRDPATKTGFANIEAWCIPIDREWFPAPAPLPWMIQRMINAENDANNGSKKAREYVELWATFSSVPSHLAERINNLLEDRAYLAPEYDWSILMISKSNSPEHREKAVKVGPFKFHIDDLKQDLGGVYVILKYEDKYLRSKAKEAARPRSKSAESINSNTSAKEPNVRSPTAIKIPTEPASASRYTTNLQRYQTYPTPYEEETPKRSFSNYSTHRHHYDRPEPQPRFSFSGGKIPSSNDASNPFVRQRSRSRTHDTHPAIYRDRDESFLEPDAKINIIERERLHSRMAYNEHNPKQSTPQPRPAYYDDNIVDGSMFPGYFGSSYNPDIGAYRMPPPRASGTHDSELHVADPSYNMSLVPYRDRPQSRTRSPPHPIIITNRIYNEPDDFDDFDRRIHRSRVPASVQDLDENDEPISGTRRTARSTSVPVQRQSNRGRKSAFDVERLADERYGSYYSDGDDIDIRITESRRAHNIGRRGYPETRENPLTQLPYAGRRPQSRIVEEEDNQSEEEIADRLVAKLSRSSAMNIVMDAVKQTDDEPEKEPLKHHPTKLSDIIEDSDEATSRKNTESGKGKEKNSDVDDMDSSSSSSLPKDNHEWTNTRNEWKSW